MVSIVAEYFGVIRVLLITVGLWPYQNPLVTRFQFILFYGILISFIILQLTTFVTTKCTVDFVIKVLSFATTFISFAMEYYTIFFNGEFVKNLVIQLQYIYDELKDKNETAILDKYGRLVKRCTVGFTMVPIFGLFGYVTSQLWPNILDVILPINHSRPHQSWIEVEYFVDQERYFYLILLHGSTAFCIGAIAATAAGTLFFAYFIWVCSIFRIASYRIEHAMRVELLKDINRMKENLIYEGLISAVNIHCKAMEFSEIIISTFEIMLLLVLGSMVLILSLNLFRIVQVVSCGNQIEELVMPIVLVSAVFFYMFSVNYIGQQVADHNNYIFVSTCNSCWYEAPVYIQKLILFLLQRANKSYNLNISKVFVMSLEGFATMTSATISYFTVLYSAQH